MKSVQLCNNSKVVLMEKHQEELEKSYIEILKGMHYIVEWYYQLIKKGMQYCFKRYIDNQAFLDSKKKAIKYLIQREKKKSADLQKNFAEKSSSTLEKYSLSLVVVPETRVEIVDYSKQNYLLDRLQSSNVINRISSEIMKYKAADAKFFREALKHQAKEATLTRKSISVKDTAALRLENCQGQRTRADDFA